MANKIHSDQHVEAGEIVVVVKYVDRAFNRVNYDLVELVQVLIEQQWFSNRFGRAIHPASALSQRSGSHC